MDGEPMNEEPTFEILDDKRGICPVCKIEGVLIYGPDPYSEEINGDSTPEWMCDGCRDQSAADI